MLGKTRMTNNYIEDGTFINSIVGEGTRLNGELDLNGLLRIDGDFSGTIRTNGKVLIGKNGRSKCTITASTVVVGGALTGNIYATEKVIILSSGILLGNIFAPRLIVEEGVVLNGNCTIKSNYADSIDSFKQPEITPVSTSKEEPEFPAEQAVASEGSPPVPVFLEQKPESYEQKIEDNEPKAENYEQKPENTYSSMQ